MHIEKIEKFRIGDLEFASLDKAQDYIDSTVDRLLRNKMLGLGFSASETFKISQVVLDNRDELVKLLSCKFEEEKPWGFRHED